MQAARALRSMSNKWSKKGQYISFENGGPGKPTMTVQESIARRAEANAFCQKRPTNLKQLWTKEELAEYKRITNGFEIEKRQLCEGNFGTKEKVASGLSVPFVVPFIFAMSWWTWKIMQGPNVWTKDIKNNLKKCNQ